MNETVLYRIEQRTRGILSTHIRREDHSRYCGGCWGIYPCDRRLDAEDTLRLVEWFKTMQEKADGQKS